MAAREKSQNGETPLSELFDSKKASNVKQQQRAAGEDQEGSVPVSFPAEKEISPHNALEIHQHHHHHHHAHGLPDQNHHDERFLDFLKAQPSKAWFQKLGIVRRLSPFSFLRKPSKIQNPPATLPTTTTPASVGTVAAAHHQDIQHNRRRRRRGFRVPFVRKINWVALWRFGKNWVRHPANFALFLWLIACGVALFILLLLIIGALNGVITDATTRRRWVEVVNQVLNALFTVMCLYQHPRIIHHLIMLVRWTDHDQAGLRVLYCGYKESRPKERVRMMFVLVLLHATCFAQYGLCFLFWAYNRHNRPDLGQIVCIGVGIVAPVVAALYTLYGPLAKKDDNSSSTTDDEESLSAIAAAADDGEMEEMGGMEVKVMTSGTVTPNGGKVIVAHPEWVGGLFEGLLDDAPVAGLSFFCTFCVFGWNMERLGFGNMYVHVATFVLLCLAPIWVFAVTGLKVDDDDARAAVWIVGVLLSFLGLLYGGFWRTRMRRRFGLPADRETFFGYASLADYAKWLFCWTCALAQEVRTGNFYDVEQDSFYSKQDRSVKVYGSDSGARSSSDNGWSSPMVLLSREGVGSEKVFGEEATGYELEKGKLSLAEKETADPLSAPPPAVIRVPEVNGR